MECAVLAQRVAFASNGQKETNGTPEPLQGGGAPRCKPHPRACAAPQIDAPHHTLTTHQPALLPRTDPPAAYPLPHPTTSSLNPAPHAIQIRYASGSSIRSDDVQLSIQLCSKLNSLQPLSTCFINPVHPFSTLNRPSIYCVRHTCNAS